MNVEEGTEMRPIGPQPNPNASSTTASSGPSAEMLEKAQTLIGFLGNISEAVALLALERMHGDVDMAASMLMDENTVNELIRDADKPRTGPAPPPPAPPLPPVDNSLAIVLVGCEILV